MLPDAWSYIIAMFLILSDTTLLIVYCVNENKKYDNLIGMLLIVFGIASIVAAIL